MIKTLLCNILVFVLLSTLCGRDIFVDKTSKNRSGSIGTKENPFRTITAAVKAAKAGDSIIVCPGIYRESVIIPTGGTKDKPLILKSLRKHQAVISGSNRINKFIKYPQGVYSCGKFKLFYSQKHTFVEDGRSIPGNQVYVDGEPLTWVDDRTKLLPGCWTADARPYGRIYFCLPENKSPKDSKVEIALRDLLLGGKGDYIKIKNFKFTHAADAVKSSRRGLMISGKGWEIIGNLCEWNSTHGIYFSNCCQTLIADNTCRWSGDLGLFGSSGMDMTIRNNTFLYSNWRKVLLAWGGGGTKILHSLRNVYENNHSAWNYGPGVWFDIITNRNVVKNNILHDNQTEGGGAIFLEIGWNDSAYNNLIYNSWAKHGVNSSGNGIRVSNCSNTIVRNNIVFNNAGNGINVLGPHGRSASGYKKKKKKLQNKKIFPWMSAKDRQVYLSEFEKYVMKVKAFKPNNNVIKDNYLFDNGRGDIGGWASNNAGYKLHNEYIGNLFLTANGRKPFSNFNNHKRTISAWNRVTGQASGILVSKPPKWVPASVEWDKLKFRNAKKVFNDTKGLVESPNAAILYGRIARAENVRYCRLPDNINGVYLKNNGQSILALWTSKKQERKHARFKSGSGQYKVESPWLNLKKRQSKDGEFEILVTDRPTYIHDTDALKNIPAPKLTVKYKNEISKPVTAVFFGINSDSKGKDIKIKIEPPKDWKVDVAEINETLESGKKISRNITMTYPENTANGLYKVRVLGHWGATPIERVCLFGIGKVAGKSSDVIERMKSPVKIDGSMDEWTGMAPIGTVNSLTQVCEGNRKSWRK